MKLQAKKREITGKKVKTIRKLGRIPAVVFEPKKESLNVSVDYIAFIKAYRQAGETEVIELDLEDKKYPVIIEEVSYHPVSEEVLHVNFRIVDLKQKIRVNVPVVFINEETHPLLKTGEALLLTQLDEIEVEALPNDLPKEIVLDVQNLKEIGESFTIKDVKKVIDITKVELIEQDEELVVAALDYAQQQEEEEEGPKEVEDVEITTEKKEEGTTEEAPKKEDKNKKE